MSAGWQWKVQAEAGKRWSTQVDRLNRQTAGETAEFYARRYEWTLRLLDDETGETVKLGPDGTPLAEVEK